MGKRKFIECKKTFENISPSEALLILKKLGQEDPIIRKRIEEIFINQVREVNISEISEEVVSDLDFLDVEDLWDRSGSYRDGYTDPGEAAFEMIEEVVEPHIEQMKRFRSLGMFHEEMRYCIGVISGLYAFEDKSTTEFKGWAEDMAGELASQILIEWKNSCNSSELMVEMKRFEATGYCEELNEKIESLE